MTATNHDLPNPDYAGHNRGLLCDDPWILEATEFNPGQCCLSERSDKSRHEAGNDQRDSPG